MSSSSRKMLQAAAGNAGGGDFYPYTVDYSARFNSGDSPILTRTPSNTSSTQWTLSFWTKLTASNKTQTFVNAGTADGSEDLIAIKGNGYLFYRYDTTSNFHGDYSVFYRDPSAWYHIVLKWDSANATTSDRLAWYVNGNLAPTASGDTNYPSLNQTSRLTNSSYTTVIGEHQRINNHLDAYLSQFAFVDGQALDPTDFAEYKNGVWVPKDITGLTYGTNGYLLDFADSSALGNDVSGNNNDFTSSGLTSSDQTPDTPTNNFCTINPIDISSSTVISDGNLDHNGGQLNTIFRSSAGTHAVSSGKWYAEVYCASTYQGHGIIKTSVQVDNGGENWIAGSEGWAMYINGDIYHDGSAYSYASTSYGAGSIIGILLDCDNDELTYYINGVSQGAFSIDADSEYRFGFGTAGSTGRCIANFGQDSSFSGAKTAQGNTDANGIGDFYYTVPTDALALCTANFPEPTIGPNSAENVTDYFNVVLYTGNGTAIGSGGKSITGVGFTPDHVVIKSRDSATSWMQFDTTRGATKYLTWDVGILETTDTESLTSFDADGFTLGNNSSVNSNGINYVAYCWKKREGLHDIVAYTGNNATPQSISHNLNAVPNWMMTPRISDYAGNWLTYIDGGQVTDPETDYGYLDLTNAFVDDSTIWNDTAPTSSQFTVGANNGNNGGNWSFMNYLWANMEGMCKVGSYTGNGSTDGPFVYTGFRPAWLMIKRTDSADNWDMHDSARGPYNVNDWRLYANLSNAEASGGSFGADFLSNGFKLRTTNGGWNASGGSYIYMAFAENPFKYANAR